MRVTLAFTIKEFLLLLRDPGGLFVLFMMPVMFMVVFSLALGGLFEEGAARGSARALEVPVAIGGAGEVAEQVVEQLDATQGLAMIREQDGQALTAEAVAQLVADGAYPVGVVFPDGLTALLEDPRILRGEQVKPLEVDVIVDPATTAQVTGPLEGALSAVLQQVVGRRLGEAGAAAWFEQVAAGLPAEVRAQLAASMQPDGQGEGALPVTTRRRVPPGVEREQFPDQFQQNAAGYTVMGVFFIATVMIESIFRERRSGAMRRLRAAPVGRAPIVISKLVPFYVVNLIQIVIMFAIARLAFGLDLGFIPAVVVVSAALALVATGMGIALAGVARSETQGTGLAVIVVLTTSALGGVMVPRFIMPEAMQQIGNITPQAWAIQGYQDVLVRGQGLGGVWLEACVLLIFAAVFTVIGVWRFRFD
ncbi:MAG: ABC transporter permease [Chloroflexota bacterium]|nr:ABC transporter permease [Chloroflexota bacterium]MDE2920748.1 ABC transporter permease [Chloroflexota bacterium]